MTTDEFSAMFDTILNSYSTPAMFGSDDNPADIRLNEYEKSVFLSKAQEEYILSIFSRQSNVFEDTELDRRKYNNLLRDFTSDLTSVYTNHQDLYYSKFKLPEDCLSLVYEEAQYDSLINDRCFRGKWVAVYPIRHDEYTTLVKNPFRGPNGKRVLREDVASDEVKLIGKYPIIQYRIIYAKRPNPIILVDLKDEGLSIDGHTSVMGSELPEFAHQDILNRAVALAVMAKAPKVNNSKN